MAIAGIQKIVREFGDGVANGCPPWAAYRELILGHLISLKKLPGFWTVVVGETWLWMLDKYILVVTGAEAKEACGADQICGGLEVGIEGGIHMVRILCQQQAQ